MIGEIEILIKQIISVTEGWIRKDEKGYDIFVDPNDHEEISAHYGASHMAASLIIWGKHTNDQELYNKGINLLKSILAKWNVIKTLPSFHFDFNNFALTLVEDKVDDDIKEKIHSLLIYTEDSNHDTINWLPMRWFVNLKRLEWTKQSKFQSNINRCKHLIKKATNADGGIEDRLPYGMSYNLQYNLATVAVLQYLRVQGQNIDLSKELGFLINAIAPDGDINYQGRGTNQVFAWGLWIYLLSSSSQQIYLKKALNYFSSKLKIMLVNNSMMLNSWDGKEKYLWWDYHYTSVYVAHCLLWLVLAVQDNNKMSIDPIFPISSETGLHVYRSSRFSATWFSGRTEYLAEKGPAIAMLWSKKQGMICKGAFAPWQGAFGNHYIYDSIVLKNYCGLVSVKRNRDLSKNRYLHKLFPNFKLDEYCAFKPIFCPVEVDEELGSLKLTWQYKGCDDFIFNLPCVNENCDFNLYVDGKPVNVFCTEAIKNQYSWVYLHQSKAVCGHEIVFVIK